MFLTNICASQQDSVNEKESCGLKQTGSMLIAICPQKFCTALMVYGPNFVTVQNLNSRVFLGVLIMFSAITSEYADLLSNKRLLSFK
jgi:hypothetical protein